jgi:ribose 5-phosphate isomerase A
VEFKTQQDAAKFAAGKAAVSEYLRDGMKIGLGSGTSSHWFVRGLAEDVRQGLEIIGVPTSTATRDLALELGVPLGDLDEVGVLDLTVDGADEIDGAGAMIKGGGGCLLWERIVANASRRMVAVVDDTKLVDVLGAFPLPIEVVRFGWKSTRRTIAGRLADMGYEDVRMDRRARAGEPFVTDSGNYILDAHLERIADKDALGDALLRVPGVVDHGLFVRVASEVVIGHPDGSADIRRL